jgi:3alpha(or 20beta)-hydroxysteroid dehydrogenase
VTDLHEPQPRFEHGAIHSSVMNVASEAAWDRQVEQIIERHGVIDVLVNNAGIGGSVLALAEEHMDSWNQVVAVNQTGVFLGMRAVLPSMRAQRRGSIINISSIWGNSAVRFAAAYHATKAAVRHLTKHAAVTYGPENIRVNSVHPGIIATPLVLEGQSREASERIIAATPLGRMGEPVEIANGILFLASDESSYVTGTELVIDGGYLAQ